MHKLRIFKEKIAICKLSKFDRAVIDLMDSCSFCTLVKDINEYSLICDEALISSLAGSFVNIERNYVLIKFDQEFGFDEIGVLESALKPLAANAMSVLAISSYSRDYVLVKAKNLELAKQILRSSGFEFLD